MKSHGRLEKNTIAIKRRKTCLAIRKLVMHKKFIKKC